MKGKLNMRFNPETKTYKLFSALHKGETLTASQAEKRFGVKNISAEVSRIRQAGFARPNRRELKSLNSHPFLQCLYQSNPSRTAFW